jgi:tRNA threonylcarbamoyladenosine biosynthesis protein TsaB
LAKILCIETTTKTCAIGVAVDGCISALREDHSSAYSHAEQLHRFIEEVVSETQITYNEFDAIAVSKGPGSYTGLRIGVSAAKGMAFAKNIPIIAVDPLKALAAQVAHEADAGTLLIAMIDARRMEVFCAGFKRDLSQVFPTRAEVLTAHSFPEAAQFSKLIYFGDGAAKGEALFGHPLSYRFLPNVRASVRGMAGLAEEGFLAGDFVSTAYFEPYYLKDFVAGKPKKGFA